MKKFIVTCLAVACLATNCQTFLPGADTTPPAKEAIHITIAPWPTIYFRAHAVTQTFPALDDSPVDGIYWCPTLAQLTKMDQFVRPKQHPKYTNEAWDCDDMAKEWVSLTHLWASHEFLPGAPVSLATFLCYVKIHAGAFDGRWDAEGKHALGLLCDNTGTWWFVEAQTGMHQLVEEAYFEGTIEVMKIVW